MDRCVCQSQPLIPSSASQSLPPCYTSSIRGRALPRICNSRVPDLQLRCRGTPSLITALCFRAMDIMWQPPFLSQGFDSEKLLAEAPTLLKHCEDLDWKKQTEDLRTLALLSLSSTPEPQRPDDDRGSSRDDNGGNSSGPWFTAGAALAAILLQGGLLFTAFAEEMAGTSESAEAASRAPGWLVPAVLAFPVVSYVAFNVYRDQVNPYAKVTDWMFGVVAVVIVANLILISTIGVRLY